MATVFTIGYEGTDVERFVATLVAAGVDVVADVRAVTASRKPGFSKVRLSERLRTAGIAYLHFGDLGDPKAGREAARAGRFADFKRIYGAHLASVPAQAALKELADTAESRRTCLMCFERDPKMCHRSIVAGALAPSVARVFDLFGDDPGRYVRHASKLPGGHPYQSAPST